MALIRFHHAGGTVDEITVEPGINAMRAAVNNGVDGIVGECGGQLMCSTCHCYVRSTTVGELPEITEDEEEMLEATSAPRDPERSRLGCQLVIGPDLEVLEVDVPDSQV